MVFRRDWCLIRLANSQLNSKELQLLTVALFLYENGHGIGGFNLGMRARSGQVYSTIFQFTPYFLIYISVFNSNFTIASLASWASPTKRKKGGYSNPPHINIILPLPYAYISSIMNNTTHPISIPTGNYSKRELIKLPLLRPWHVFSYVEDKRLRQ